MNTPLNLKELENKAFRSFYQDGIWDIFFGLMLLAMWGFTLFDDMENKAVRMLVMLFIEIGAMFFLIYGKKQITVPRLGEVTFGKKRKRRLLYVFLANSLSVLFIAALLVMNIADVAWLENDTVSSVFLGVWIVFITSVMAFFLDFDRLYIYAVILGGAFTAVLLTGIEILFLVGALLILVPGVAIFIRFLREYKPSLVE
ncbi:MAG: hypothetical protein JW757_06080 [Anaerolineales bacterium]|nr:hypothetical protein [Anaerolineales bacterium]